MFDFYDFFDSNLKKFESDTSNLLNEFQQKIDDATRNTLPEEEKALLNQVKSISPNYFDYDRWEGLIYEWVKKWIEQKDAPIRNGRFDYNHLVRETLKALENMPFDARKEFFNGSENPKYTRLPSWPRILKTPNEFYFSKFRNAFKKYTGLGDTEGEIFDKKTINAKHLEAAVPEKEWRENIRLAYASEKYLIWGTKKYDVTTYKFITLIWNTPNPDAGDYGDPSHGSPYCTKQKEHWMDYAKGDENYEQFWIFRNFRNSGLSSHIQGNCTNPIIANCLERLRGLGPKILIGNIDTILDVLDRFDEHDSSFLDDELKSVFRKMFNIEEPESMVNYQNDENGNLVCQIKLVDSPFYDSNDVIEIRDGVQIVDCGFEKHHATKSTNIQLQIPDSVVRISRAQGVHILNLPKNLYSIGRSAFDLSTFFTENLVLPKSVREIGECAFAGTNIKSLTIPSSDDYVYIDYPLKTEQNEKWETLYHPGLVLTEKLNRFIFLKQLIFNDCEDNAIFYFNFRNDSFYSFPHTIVFPTHIKQIKEQYDIGFVFYGKDTEPKPGTPEYENMMSNEKKYVEKLFLRCMKKPSLIKKIIIGETTYDICDYFGVDEIYTIGDYDYYSPANMLLNKECIRAPDGINFSNDTDWVLNDAQMDQMRKTGIKCKAIIGDVSFEISFENMRNKASLYGIIPILRNVKIFGNVGVYIKGVEYLNLKDVFPRKLFGDFYISSRDSRFLNMRLTGRNNKIDFSGVNAISGSINLGGELSINGMDLDNFRNVLFENLYISYDNLRNENTPEARRSKQFFGNSREFMEFIKKHTPTPRLDSFDNPEKDNESKRKDNEYFESLCLEIMFGNSI